MTFLLVVKNTFRVVGDDHTVSANVFSFLGFAGKLRGRQLVGVLKMGGMIVSLIVVLFDLFNSMFNVDRRALTFIVVVIPLTVSVKCSSVAKLYVMCMTTRVNFSNTMLGPFAVNVTRNLSSLPLFSKFRCHVFY